MVQFFRVLLFLMLGGSAVCLLLSVITGNQRLRYWGVQALKWTVIVGLVFFAGMVFERVV